MSRTSAQPSQDPRVPNMQAMVINTPGRLGPGGDGVVTEYGGSSKPREVTTGEVLKPATEVGSVVTGWRDDVAPKKRYFRVVKAGLYKPKGVPDKSMMAEGRMIDDANYDIAAMRAQGLKLVEVDSDGEEIQPKPKSEKKDQ